MKTSKISGRDKGSQVRKLTLICILLSIFLASIPVNIALATYWPSEYYEDLLTYTETDANNRLTITQYELAFTNYYLDDPAATGISKTYGNSYFKNFMAWVRFKCSAIDTGLNGKSRYYWILRFYNSTTTNYIAVIMETDNVHNQHFLIGTYDSLGIDRDTSTWYDLDAWIWIRFRRIGTTVVTEVWTSDPASNSPVSNRTRSVAITSNYFNTLKMGEHFYTAEHNYFSGNEKEITVLSLNPTIGTFIANPNEVYKVYNYTIVSCKISNPLGYGGLVSCQIELGPYSVILGWGYMDTFTKDYDPNNYVTLDVSGCQKVIINQGTFEIRWRIKFNSNMPDGYVDVYSTNTLVTNDWGLTGTGSYNDLILVQTYTPPPTAMPLPLWGYTPFLIRMIGLVGPFGFMAYRIRKIESLRDGLECALVVGVCFTAFIILWFMADVIEEMMTNPIGYNG